MSASGVRSSAQAAPAATAPDDEETARTLRAVALDGIGAASGPAALAALKSSPARPRSHTGGGNAEAPGLGGACGSGGGCGSGL
ncbi:hypothetical protein ACFWSP_22085 [Streptomyces sp. NPDC058618]|uniref:hypothetical protein n=1 Tax=Streptomyces sp. NPDC058618 TaxID=3346558 RepID=UPI003661D691